MRFLAFAPQAAWALLAAVATVIVALYLLRPRPRRMVVASTLIWRKLGAARRWQSERGRWWLSLLLSLVIGLGIALAMTRPEVPRLGGEARNLVLLLDDAPSMGARTADGRTRWERAAASARRLVLEAAPGSEFLVLDTMGRGGASGFVGRNAANAAIDALLPALSGTARLPPLPETPDPHRVVVFVTDGVNPLPVGPSVRVESVFESADNAAITAFQTRPMPGDPTRYQALVQVFNASAADKRVELHLDGLGFSSNRELQVAAGETVHAAIDVSRFAAGVLRARVVTPGDAFAPDDFAYAVVPVHSSRTVLLVTAGNPRLEESLRLLPGVRLTVQRPSEYRASRAYDACVFDRFAPRQAPEVGSLFFHPRGTRRDAVRPVITRWNADHPLGAGLPWQDVRVERAALMRPPADAATAVPIVLAKSSEEGVLVSATTKFPRRVDVAFRLDDSNLALQGGFPVFLGLALDWIAPKSDVLERPVGTVEVASPAARVLTQAGVEIKTIATESGAVFESEAPDVFTVSSPEGEYQIVTVRQDLAFSDINRSPFARGAAPHEADGTRAPARWPIDLSALLLALVAVLLPVEWIGYCRRATV